MRPIFVSYRREDSEGEAGRLFDDLVGHFGETAVFLDVAAIEVGRDFRKAIDESVASCGVLLAVIGKNWIDARNEEGHRRLDDPSDFVRLETASALKRDIPVIPVLVHGARMPRPEQLPADLKELAYRNGVELTHARWRSDVELLIKALGRHVGGPKDPEEHTNKIAEKRATTVPAAAQAQGVDEVPRIPEKFPAPWWRSRRAILTFVLSAFALAAGAYWLRPKQTTVPDLTGSTLSDATAKLEGATLVVGRTMYNPSTEKKPDTVLSQSPSPNTRVGRRTAVDLVIAQSSASVNVAAKVVVPGLKGISLNEAESAILGAHLVVGNISREPRSDVARNIVLDEFPVPGKSVDTGTAIDLVVSEALAKPAASLSQAAPVPDHPPQQPKVPPALPNFAGTWSLYENTMNGVTQAIPASKPILVTQNGTIVRIGGRDLQITSIGTVSYQTFSAHDDKYGHAVATADQADLVDTLTWKIEGSVLVFETVFDYRRQYYNDPPGKKVRIMKYRRAAAQ